MNNKKILSIFFLVLVLFSVFIIPIHAADYYSLNGDDAVSDQVNLTDDLIEPNSLLDLSGIFVRIESNWSALITLGTVEGKFIVSEQYGLITQIIFGFDADNDIYLNDVLTLVHYDTVKEREVYYTLRSTDEFYLYIEECTATEKFYLFLENNGVFLFDSYYGGNKLPRLIGSYFYFNEELSYVGINNGENLYLFDFTIPYSGKSFSAFAIENDSSATLPNLYNLKVTYFYNYPDTPLFQPSYLGYKYKHGNFWSGQVLRLIRIDSLPLDAKFLVFLFTNSTYITDNVDGLSQLLSGYDGGYDDGYRDGKDVGQSSVIGENLIGSTLMAPIRGLDSIVLFTTTSGYNVTLWRVFSACVGLGLFIWFVRMFAGG